MIGWVVAGLLVAAALLVIALLGLTAEGDR